MTLALTRLLGTCALFAALAGPTARAEPPGVLPALDQGWTQTERLKWYRASQGSRLMPLDWFLNLETRDGDSKFAAFSNLSRFGYLALPGAAAGDLPIGFARDVQSDERFQRTRLRWKAEQGDSEPWLGLTCAACHTGVVESEGGKAFLIDGAAGASDFQSFIEELNGALEATRKDADKWGRFAARMLPEGDSDDGLKQAFDMLLAWQLKEAAQNETPLRYGPGRIDAFGHIFNKVALTLDYERAVANPADAPVSIPYIWRAAQLDAVQYDGLVPNKVVGNIDFGALGRNSGEVIGVFGDIAARSSPGVFNGFPSSLRIDHLVGLEDQLARLRPPAWPRDVLGVPDPQMVASGGTLLRANCETSSCHQPVDRSDLATPIKTTRAMFAGHSPGTDPWMACNAVAYKSSAGALAGLQSDWITDGARIGPQASLAVLLQATVKATLLDKKTDILQASLHKLFNLQLLELAAGAPPLVALPPADPRRSAQKQAQLDGCGSNALFGYTSRPLNGVWATAPYLHNGSVPTIFDLLSPPEKRPTHFLVGTRRYDAKKMGLSTAPDAPGNTFDFKSSDAVGPIDGNSNAGHDYNNAKFTDEERYQIIEYLKSL